MDVAAVWLVYLMIVIVLWIAFWFPSDSKTGLPGLFYALLIGFLFIYLVAPAFELDTLSDEERAWFNALTALSLLLPAVVIGLMIAFVYQKVYDDHC